MTSHHSTTSCSTRQVGSGTWACLVYRWDQIHRTCQTAAALSSDQRLNVTRSTARWPQTTTWTSQTCKSLQLSIYVATLTLVMLNSNFFQNRNLNPKNRLKLETGFLLYPSSMVKRVRISTFDFHSRLVDRRSAHIKRSENLTCARSDSDSCVARLTVRADI